MIVLTAHLDGRRAPVKRMAANKPCALLALRAFQEDGTVGTVLLHEDSWMPHGALRLTAERTAEGWRYTGHWRGLIGESHG